MLFAASQQLIFWEFGEIATQKKPGENCRANPIQSDQRRRNERILALAFPYR